MLRSLAFQLYKFGFDSAKEPNSLFRSHRNGRDQPGIKALFNYFYAMARIPTKMYIVLDTLDECTTRTELLWWTRSFVSSSEFAHVQLIATGRPEAAFLREPPSVFGESNCVSLDKECIDADIRSYIISRLEESPEFQKWASFLSVLQQIPDEIGGRPDGMFRWAAYQLNNLEACLGCEGYRSRSQIHPTRRKGKAIRLLQFLVHAKRPLTLPEAGGRDNRPD
ncbi:hypothetical protein DL765_005749 [Monosporascus sp. GIB2]|nr:hypothetical protein DL765_005749 [Monosporascus sp. GIB2]